MKTEPRILKADFNFDFIDLDGQIKKEIEIKQLMAFGLAVTKSINIDALTAFEWALKIKKDGFIIFSSSAEHEKFMKFLEIEYENSPFVKGFIISELKKQNK